MNKQKVSPKRFEVLGRRVRDIHKHKTKPNPNLDLKRYKPKSFYIFFCHVWILIVKITTYIERKLPVNTFFSPQNKRDKLFDEIISAGM